MFSNEEYLLAWSIYLASCVGLMIVWWAITRPIGHVWTRQFLRLTAAVCMLTPHSTGVGEQSIAPAFLMLVYEAVFTDEAVSRNGAPLLMVLVIALAVFVALQILLNRRQKPLPPVRIDPELPTGPQ